MWAHLLLIYRFVLSPLPSVVCGVVGLAARCCNLCVIFVWCYVQSIGLCAVYHSSLLCLIKMACTGEATPIVM